MFQESDGVILGTNITYEGPAVDVWKKWFGKRPVLCVGPITPISSGICNEEEGICHDILKFMNNAQHRFGNHSIVYVGFSSLSSAILFSNI